MGETLYQLVEKAGMLEVFGSLFVNILVSIIGLKK